MAEVGSDLVSSFVIKELTGDKRTLTLKTRALPYRPFTLEGSQRNSIDWYPGSPIGTLQVYGAKEEPSTISGEWKDIFLGGQAFGAAPATVAASKSSSVSIPVDAGDGTVDLIESEAISLSERVLSTARELVSLVDDMRRKGQEIEVTWLDQIRRGIIERFTVRWNTGHDCAWDITFAWISQGESLTDTKLQDAGNNLGDLPNQLQSQIDAMTAANLGDLGQSGTRFASASEALSAVGANIQEFTDALTDAVIQAGQAITTPNDAMRRVSGVLDGIKLEAEELINLAEGVADGALLDTGALNRVAVTVLSFGQLLAARGQVREQANAAASIRNLAAREQLKLLNSISSTIISVFQARDNQDLRQVSQTFYGTPDEWRSLMVYNHLLSSGLLAGQVIFVPAQPPQDGC
jgi:hypothetical protein